jgi:hypothetical protein
VNIKNARCNNKDRFVFVESVSHTPFREEHKVVKLNKLLKDDITKWQGDGFEIEKYRSL